MKSAVDRIGHVARCNKEARFTALLHHINVESLREAYRKTNPKATPGIDGMTWKEYGKNLEENLNDLVRRVHTGGYRARASLRTYIPKADGKKRPLGIAVLEDKILQRALVKVLNAIYEQDFLGFSYGFRPGRSQHQALDALFVAIDTKKVNWVLDADISGFFDAIDHECLIRMIERRIGDKRVVRLIRKWLKAGILEDGKKREQTEGTPQGATISPLLANIYLHYGFDAWAQHWRRTKARGDVIIVRYADDIVVGFQYRDDAEKFLKDMRKRMSEYKLKLHPKKTRLIEFGRFAAERRKEHGKGKPETFDFLGFTHICGKTKGGRFLIHRHTIKKRMRTKLKEIKEGLRRRMHQAIIDQGRWLKRVINGYYNYHAVPTNLMALNGFREEIIRKWKQTLGRRSQKGYITWERMKSLKEWLPLPKIRHPLPPERFVLMTRGRSPVR